MLGPKLHMENPTPKGENKISSLEIIPTPENYHEVVYVVHPSTIDGDTNFEVQEPIQKYIDNQTAGQKVVLIAPPQKCTYLKPSTKVTDIRSDDFHLNWVESNDLKKEVEQITLIGGNLEKCLGSIFQSVYWFPEKTKDDESKYKEIKINLPLEAIYTTKKTSAEIIFNLLKSHKGTSEIEAVVALLTSVNAESSYNKDFEIITSDARIPYVINVNGNLLGTLTPISESELPTKTEFPKFAKFISDRKCYLNITFKDIALEQANPLDKYENELLETKIEHAKKVLGGYLIVK